MAEMTLERARRAWSAGQGLETRSTDAVAKCVAATGWLRSIGGAEPYLALVARTEKASVAAVTRALRSGALQIVPSVRGCMYVVPKAHVPLSLRVAAALGGPRLGKDLAKAGSSLDEVDGMADAILAALADAPRETRALADALPEGVVRSLGAKGKKVGLTTTLPPALRRLEFLGRVTRVPVEHRLDHERYEWAATGSTLAEVDAAEVWREMAALYFRWAGPATRKEFAAWVGCRQGDAKSAIEAAGLEAVEVEGLGEAFAYRATLDTKPGRGGPPVRFVGALDNLFAMRASSASLVAPEHAGVEVSSFGRGKRATLGDVGQPLDRTMVAGGRVVGLWAYANPGSEAFPFETLAAKAKKEARAEQARADEVFAALGHGRATSIDTDRHLEERLARMRAR